MKPHWPTPPQNLRPTPPQMPHRPLFQLLGVSAPLHSAHILPGWKKSMPFCLPDPAYPVILGISCHFSPWQGYRHDDVQSDGNMVWRAEPPVAWQERTPLTLSSEEHLVQAPLSLCKVQALLSLCKLHTFAPGRHHQRCKRTKIHARSHWPSPAANLYLHPLLPLFHHVNAFLDWTNQSSFSVNMKFALLSDIPCLESKIFWWQHIDIYRLTLDLRKERTFDLIKSLDCNWLPRTCSSVLLLHMSAPLAPTPVSSSHVFHQNQTKWQILHCDNGASEGRGQILLGTLHWHDCVIPDICQFWYTATL